MVRAPSRSFLDGLDAAAAAELASLGARRRFPAGSVLFVEGDAAHEVLVVRSGSVKASVASVDGHELVLDVFEAGTLLGELAVLDGGRRTASLTALSTVEVLAVGGDAFNAFLDRHPAAMRLLLVEVVHRLRTRVRHQLEFGTGDALGRVCARLAELADRYGVAEDGAIRIPSPVTQSELASWTGLSREAVVKALRALRRLAWIDTQAGTFVLRAPDEVRHRATR